MSLSEITLAPVFPTWLIILLLALAGSAAVWQYVSNRKKLGRGRALGLSLLRLAALFLLVSFALNPSVVQRKEQKVPPVLAVIVDTSASMALAGHPGKGSRLDEAKSFLSEGPQPILGALAERFEVRFYGLGETLKPIGPGELSGLRAEGEKGDLAGALKDLAGKTSLALFLSDGGWPWEKTPEPQFPLIAIPLGDAGGYRDIAIKAVKAPALAFRGREVTIEATVRGYGYAGVALPVALKEGERLITAKSLHLGASPGEATVSFSFTPEETGEHNLSLSVPPQFGEAVAANNTVHHSIKVIRDKIRVLMVSGSPSMNYRFLRKALKNAPSIDLLSFVILRTPSNILNVPLEEQSLIPFPVETLFAKELKSFDLLIFDNFRFQPYFGPKYLENVKEFVRAGGGFAAIGGPDFLGEGGYAGTPLEEILPIKWTGKESYRRDSPFGVKLSKAGMSHPLTRLLPDERENAGLWREMPPIEGINPAERNGSATVLLESADGASRPVLTAGRYGQGRVLVLATDYSWKWYMGMVAAGKGNWPYLRFAERLVRWLTKDPGLDLVQIKMPEKEGAPGQETEFRVRSDGQGPISLSVFSPEGVRIASRLRPMGNSGEYLASFSPGKGGTYRIKVETRSGDREESIVIPGLMQGLDGAPHHELLSRIAARSGGKIPGSREELLKAMESYAEKAEVRFPEESRRPLWAGWPILLIVGLLAGEWYLRRRWGLI